MKGLNACTFITTKQTTSADEDCEIQLKVEKQANGAEIILFRVTAFDNNTKN